jgi:DNA-binding MarR family transcriptional regulator
MRRTKRIDQPYVQPTNGGRIFPAFVFELFRTYSRLNSAGDDIARGFGLSAARWRVLGSACESPKTVSAIARERGLTRQSVQQIVNSLLEERLAKLIENKDHKSAKLVAPTPVGKRAILDLNRQATGWMNGIADAVSAKDLETATRVLERLRIQIDTIMPDRTLDVG